MPLTNNITLTLSTNKDTTPEAILSILQAALRLCNKHNLRMDAPSLALNPAFVDQSTWQGPTGTNETFPPALTPKKKGPEPQYWDDARNARVDLCNKYNVYITNAKMDNMITDLRNNKKISAIKYAREQFRLGLKDAKHLVDDIVIAAGGSLRRG